MMNEIIELKQLMEDISERCYCAEWAHNIEYEVWCFIQMGCKDTKCGMNVISGWELTRIKELAEKVGGWWIHTDMIDTYFGQAFILMDDWLDYYEYLSLNNIKDN